MSDWKKKKIEEIAELEKRQRQLTSTEYLNLLKDVRDSWALTMLDHSLHGKAKQAHTALSILDKIHWLIESAEKGANDVGALEGIGFDLPEYDETLRDNN